MNTHEYLKKQYPSGCLNATDIDAESLGELSAKMMKISTFVRELEKL